MGTRETVLRKLLLRPPQSALLHFQKDRENNTREKSEAAVTLQGEAAGGSSLLSVLNAPLQI